MYEACAKADDDDETRRTEAPDDFASCIQHMSRAIPLLCQLSDEEWEPLATRGQFPASRTEVFEATAAIWKGPAHAALGEWDVAAGCYWYVMEIVPGSHTARLAEKYLAELVNAGLVAKRVPGPAQSFVSLRAAFETAHTSVDWDEMAGEAIIRGRGIMLKVRPGTVAFSANGRVAWLDRPPLMEGGRVMVPETLLREVASLCAREDTTRDRGRYPAFIGPPPPAKRAQLAALWRLELGTKTSP